MSCERPPEASVEDVTQALVDIPRLYALLPEALRSRTNAAKPSPRGAHNGVIGSPAPASVVVLQLLDERTRHGSETDMAAVRELDRLAGDRRQGLLPELFMWARMIEAEMLDYSPQLPDELPEQPSVENVCAWLRPTIRWCAGRQWWDELADDVLDIVRVLRVVLGEVEQANPRHEIRFGGCGYRIDPQPGYWRCTGCGQEWTLHEVTLPEAAERLGVKLRTLQGYAQRGLIIAISEHKGQNGQQVRLFDLDSIRMVCASRALAAIA